MMKMSNLSINIGKLDQRIMIQHRTVVKDEKGNESEEWTDLHSCRCSMNGVSGREYWKAREQHEENTVSFRLRYCKALKDLNTTDYRIVSGGRVYDIIAVDNLFFANCIFLVKGVEHK